MRAAKKHAATNGRSFRTFLLMQQFDSKAVGARIAQARREADGMTQEELADLIGLSKRSVQDYEAGSTLPWKHLREIARVLDKPVEWFMRGDEPVAVLERQGLEQVFVRLESLEAQVSVGFQSVEAAIEQLDARLLRQAAAER